MDSACLALLWRLNFRILILNTRLIFSASINAANNKVGFNDLINSNNIADLIFQGNEPVNLRIDAEIYGPGLWKKTNGLLISSKAYAKLNFIDIDPKLGEAVNKG
jgi:hypothetical protein